MNECFSLKLYVIYSLIISIFVSQYHSRGLPCIDVQKYSHDYYFTNKRYFVDLLQAYVKNHNIDIQYFTCKSNDSTWSGPSYKIIFNNEHTFIHPAANPVVVNSSEPNNDPLGMNRISTFKGNLPTKNQSETYFIRLHDFSDYCTSSVMIDYNLANIYNIQMSGLFDEDFLSRIIYIPAFLYDYNPNVGKHNKIMTCFKKIYGRRRIFMEKLTKVYPNAENVNFLSIEEELQHFDSAKILINVHQTDFHHTLEEYRILPALLRGVVIVSEEVPYVEFVPYREYIIFAPYHELVDTMIYVHNNYDSIHSRFFGNKSSLPSILQTMRANASSSLEQVLNKVIGIH
eukprot:gene8157-11039_t